MGFKIILPRGVFQELKDLRLKVQHSDKSAIDIALKLFESKKINEMFGEELIRGSGKQFVWVRPFFVYGVGKPPKYQEPTSYDLRGCFPKYLPRNQSRLVF